MDRYDVIIVGGGPAGMTAGIYTSREMLDTLLLERKLTGGLGTETNLIENYPGFPEGITGMDLMDKMKEQARKFGVKIAEFEEVISLKPAAEKEILVQTAKGEVHLQYRAYSVIVASGTVPRLLNIPGEMEFRGKGVSYCATCDGPLYKHKQVAVIGCGNSGLQEGESLLRHVEKVTFVEFLPYMTGSRILQRRLKKNKRATFLLNHALTRIDGDEFVQSITVKDRENGQEKKVEVSGIFLYTGFLPATDFLKQAKIELDRSGYIKTNDQMETSIPGIYAVGDIRSKEVRQISVACGEATVAAVAASHRVETVKGVENADI